MHSLPKVAPLTAVIPEAHQKVFETLLLANKESNLNSVLRVAGGWVRDTLLGVHSNDIDIAIEATSGEPVSGERFAREVSAHEAAKSGKARTVSVIRVNPALSKHIETATVCVGDIPVEFCSLRTDDYCDDSRIPQVRVATPLEDALRRDFTVNALFFNLSTRMVEDYTTGFQDLQDRIIRCPLQPHETFTDDPLRLLRGVRFVGQLGELNFTLHPSIPECVDAKLLDTLLQKVSRERIGKEFTKMMCGARPERCVDILLSMQLLQRTLLVEVYMKQLAGKKKMSAEIDRTVCLVDVSTSTLGKSPMELLDQLNVAVSPTFSGADAYIFMSGEDKLPAMLFELVLPFFRHVPHEEVEERLYAVCINGLKLPVATFNCVRRMIDCYNALCCSELKIAELTAGMTSSTKMKIFDALGHLNDHCIIPNAFKAVLLTYLVVEERPEVLARRDVRETVSFFAPLWEVLTYSPELLDAYKLQLPVKGNELKNLCGIEAKNIGSVLLEIRKHVVINPHLTREEVINWAKQYA